MRWKSALVLLLLLAVLGGLRVALPSVRSALNERAELRMERAAAESQPLRNQIFARAAIFVSSPDNIGAVDLSRNADAPLDPDAAMKCQYVPRASSGTTPKFDCRLPDHTIVKVKYNSPEVPAEVAATRLLRALGFPADQVSLVHELVCDGCGATPFEFRTWADALFIGPVADRAHPFAQHTFEWVSMQRRFNAKSIEPAGVPGWNFFDLMRIDPAKGGASRAEVDALRLMNVFLANWDNKTPNQRLVCLDRKKRDVDDSDPQACRQPLAMLQDVGATFGPDKVNLAHWAHVPIWSDTASCVVDMKTMPWATFPPVAITEAGRVLFATRMRQVSERQIADLFRGARFPEAAWGDRPAADVTPWVQTFLDKVRQIADRPPCPS